MEQPPEQIPLLLLVTGLPCTGKTTIARQLQGKLGFPLITKDDIKERLFDTLGWSDREWSKRLGGATYEILYHLIEICLGSGVSLIAESNFPPAWAAERLRTIDKQHNFKLGVLECIAKAAVLEERWRRRAAYALRHPGHRDAEALDDFLEVVQRHTGADGYARLGVPDLGGPVWEVDTSASGKDQLNQIVREINQLLIPGKK